MESDEADRTRPGVALPVGSAADNVIMRWKSPTSTLLYSTSVMTT